MTTADRLKAEGRAETLLELLALRFGPVPAHVADTAHNASVDQLREWTARVLTADTIETVFQQ
ncbi:hypothetical protein [Nocardia sp. IFM 10818]